MSTLPASATAGTAGVCDTSEPHPASRPAADTASSPTPKPTPLRGGADQFSQQPSCQVRLGHTGTLTGSSASDSARRASGNTR